MAFGGSLTQKLHDEPGYLDHREDTTAPLEVQYGPAHEIELVEGGLLHKITGNRRIKVDSCTPRASSGSPRSSCRRPRRKTKSVEAFRIDGAKAFALAVQWHPEWQVMENPFSRALFAAFGQASRDYANRRIR